MVTCIRRLAQRTLWLRMLRCHAICLGPLTLIQTVIRCCA